MREVKEMKKYSRGTFVASLVILALFTLYMRALSPAHAETYAMTTVVVSLDYDTDVVEVEDFNGNVWVFNGCEDWLLFDVCSLVMDDNDTATMYDDGIVSMCYNGWLDGWIERVYE